MCGRGIRRDDRAELVYTRFNEPHGKRAMRMHIGCSCHPGLSRRSFMCGGLAVAARASAAPQVVAQTSPSAAAAAAAAAAQSKIGGIDIHAHYYPQGYF